MKIFNLHKASLAAFCILHSAFCFLLTGCSLDEDYTETLTPEQQSLIGRKVNFHATLSEGFTSRVSYEHSGVFNDDDIMYIYRQYYDDEKKTFDWATEDFHAYYFRRKYASGSTNISLGRDWVVAYSDKKSNGVDWVDPYLARYKGKYAPNGDSRTLTKDYQTEADSITWENGKTLRYRAWSRSNNSNALRNGSKGTYYPDFEISDWVNVSGPTNDIPLTLRHIGSRIMISYKNSGNQLAWAEISTDPEDYKRLDNAGKTEDDDTDMTYPKTFKDANGNDVTINSAEEAAAAVKAVYDRMCIPAGVDLEEGSLKGMTKAAYNATENFSKIEEWEYDETKKANLVGFGTKTAAEIATDVQRPVFTGSVNSHLHLITIPYDMSNGETSGDILTLPAWTRIKIWLTDVNGGDINNTDYKRESDYHIFALDDIKKDGATAYPNGLEMRPGYSYEFVVGYRYNTFTITPGENISWIDQDAAIAGNADDDTQTKPATGKYSWWKNAIHDAIPRGNEAYYPEFHITNEAQFLEFIDLVSGKAGQKGSETPIYRLVKEYTTVKNPNGTISKTPKTYGWSRVNDEKNAVWVEKEVLEEEGYVFYEHYHSGEADHAAYSVEDYLRGSYSFHDAGYNNPFTVYLDADLDFKDIKIDPVGISTNPFRGFFEGAPTKVVQLDGDGNMKFTDAEDPRIAYTTIENPVAHTISNLNVEGGYLFGYVKDSAIRNLMLRSYHTIGLLNTATPSMDGDNVIGWGCNIVGISVKANNTTDNHNAIANSLTGLSYVVGCIHEGDATGALVGTADNMTMYGCMRTADNLSAGALLGAYADAGDPYLAPTVVFNQFSTRPTWSRFMCNYYNKDIRENSKDATAIGGITDNYSIWYYIRGCVSRILCAQNDNLLDRKITPGQLTSDEQRREFYGLAPWKAMNYAIYKYNTDANYPGKNGHECRAHYQVGTVGYDHTYPQLVSGKPGDEYDKLDVLKQSN